MTCDDFKKSIERASPSQTPESIRIQVCDHILTCRPCSQMIKERRYVEPEGDEAVTVEEIRDLADADYAFLKLNRN